MSKLMTLLVLLGLYSSCTQSGRNPTSENSTPHILDKDTSGFVAQKVEDWYGKFDVLHIDSISINQQLSIYDSRANLEALFGKPEVLVQEEPFCVSFFSSDADHLTFLNYPAATFETLKDSVALGSLYLAKTDKRLFCPKVVLDKRTTLQSLKSIFPKSFAQQYEIEGDKKRIVLPLLTCPNCDDEFFLIFEDGLLVEIEHHMDC